MSKEMLDILVDSKKVEEIASLPTAKDVEDKLKQEGVDVTSEDVKALGNIFNTIADKGTEGIDEKIFANISGGNKYWDKTKQVFTSEGAKKAGKALLAIGGVVGVGVAGYKLKKWYKFKKDEEDFHKNNPDNKNSFLTYGW